MKLTSTIRVAILFIAIIASSVFVERTGVLFAQGTTKDVCGAAAYAIGNKGYIVSGNHGTEYLKYNWEYDPSLDTWTAKSDFGGEGRKGAAVFVIGTTAYIGMGLNTSYLPWDVWQWDQSTDTWTQKTDIQMQRSRPISFAIGGKGYVGLGENNFFTTNFYEYDPSLDTWKQLSAFPGDARQGGVSFVIGSKAYVGTGYKIDTSATYKDFWEYTPSTDTWKQLEDFSGVSRGDAVAFSIGNKGYLGTGRNGLRGVQDNYNNSDYYLDDFWEYDPATDKWTEKTKFPGYARKEAAGFAIGDKGYIGTGDWDYVWYDFYEYNPATNSWTQKAGLDKAIVSIKRMSNTDNIDIYPNPVAEELFIKYKSGNTISQEITLTITDITGREISSFMLDSKEDVLSISLSKWNNGMYLYQLFDKGTVIENGKIIVTK